ncbi:hypothetical protein Taro_020138 [Colocasia esculenta]|uniref:Aminotransferase-like plant mobile domain-containing protein n=1 Tax=Colocasia esculenta TaxID=4460 RepID=A0A843V1G0_COLES|nr:hypothetical protein [Colocasia esculenta]
MEGEDNVLLYAQEQHRSNDPDRGTYLFGSSHMLGLDDWKPTESRVLTLIRRAGFNILSKCSWVKLDRPLLTALVDRWHPETNTFHFPCGEMTSTLQDVSCILGLQIDGEPVVAAPQVPTRWRSYLDMCEELLGINILNLHVLGQYKSCLQMAFLRDIFSEINLQGQNMHVIRCYTRAYLMYLLGKALIPDISRNEIHIQYLGFLEDFRDSGKLSWGSAVLAYLYRQLTWAALKKRRKFIGGCLHLLQLWCWERLHVAGPIPRPPLNPQDVSFGARWHRRLSRETPNRTWEFYRNEFDVIEESQIIWEPYSLEDLSRVGAICRENSQLWRARVPMFYMGVMDVHMPERVWRQFGAPQVDVMFRTRELLITNPEASYLDVKNDILKLQEDTLNKLRIKIPEYEQPSNPSGAEYTPGESSRDTLTPVHVPTPPPHLIGGLHIHDEGTQLTPHIEEEDEGNDETQRRMIRGRGKRIIFKLLLPVKKKKGSVLMQFERILEEGLLRTEVGRLQLCQRECLISWFFAPVAVEETYEET